MPVYRDDVHKTWFYVLSYYDDSGKIKQKRKLGFLTKKEATEALRKLEVQFMREHIPNQKTYYSSVILRIGFL